MFQLPQTNLQNVVRGNVATLTLPLGPTYDKLHFTLLGGLSKADIERIEGKIDGRRFFETTPAELDARQAYMNIPVQADKISMDFTEPFARGNAIPQLLASIPSALLQSLTFEFTIAPTAAETSRMRCNTETRGPTQNDYIVKRQKYNYPLTTAGENNIFIGTGIAGAILKRLYLFERNAAGAAAEIIDRAALYIQNARVFDLERSEIEYGQKLNDLIPQNNLVIIDFVMDGNMDGVINTSKSAQASVELRLNTTASGSVIIVQEMIDPIKRL